jgi:16S rRNA (uracil1498-N3)-methyltransferase
MAEHRFFAGDVPVTALEPNATVVLPADAAHRIARVLRLRPGDRIRVFGEGREFLCALVEAGRQVRVRVLTELPALPPQRRLVLYPALIRPNRFEWLIEKTTEVGVAAIVPVVSEHSAVRPEEIGASRQERWRRIAVEAAEQCGRRSVPPVAAPLPYAEALKGACGRIVLAWEGLRGAPSPPAPLPPRWRGESEPSPRTSQAGPEIEGGSRSAVGSTDEPEPIALFVGPEGGWSEAEVEAARAAGAQLIGLGPNVLRAETAAIVASAPLLR